MRQIGAYLNEWGLILAGLALFGCSLPLYVSHTHRTILDRWSFAYFALQILIFVCIAIFAVVTWRSAARGGNRQAIRFKQIFGGSLACWGMAYLLSALDDPRNAGRITDLNILGSTLPSAAILEWASVAVATLAVGLSIARLMPKKWLNISLMLGALISVSIVGEGLSRAKAIIYPETQGFPTYSSELWGRKYVRINTEGFRDIDRALQNEEGNRRILLVGDSFAFGAGVDNPGDRLGEQLEARLEATGSPQWEVINASLGDTHTLQHIDFLQRMLKYGPELIILLYVFNDIDYLAPVTPRPPAASSSLSVIRFFFINSYLFQEIYVRVRKLGFSLNRTVQSPYLDDALLQKHYEDLRQFVAVAEASGSVARIVPFSFQIGDAHREIYNRFVEGALSFGLPVCSLKNAFDDYLIDDLRVNALDGHPNAFANHIAVRAAFDCLSSAIGSVAR